MLVYVCMHKILICSSLLNYSLLHIWVLDLNCSLIEAIEII